ncbi:HD-like signal output (HDOD) domain, no enzymatic activity [Marinobacter daqiaonensis]|uniref:histidine kinase n=1 Tax=Marinobacter daqiaonensis TaxID=650891 RepID=A0A1I6J8M2_9GAMM|nr:HDOD domain-containing protein [Marinobacter daqiaonensis]SFR75335.1 HD-like signal output (HDOD) domain, no enzymatic activity [Marinobacter daqiaonensis]
MTTSAASDQLPTLPEVHLRALDACRRHDSYRQVARIIHQDTSLTGCVLALANAAGFHHQGAATHLEQALLRLGTERLEKVILTGALQQLLLQLGEGHWRQLNGFWRDALSVALMARALARLTRYPEPDTAFLAGMLHNAGKLLLLRRELERPQQEAKPPYPQLSATLAEHWGLGSDLSEALARQLDDSARLAGADHLIRISAVSVHLVTREGHGLTMARELFGLEEELSAEILRRIRLETTDLAEEMDIAPAAIYNGDAGTRKLTVAVVREILARDLHPPVTAGLSDEVVRRQIHEINNPLTVVRQYLFRLRARLREGGDDDDIDVIEEELGRASELLAELGRSGTENPYPGRDPGRRAILNYEVTALGELLDEGLFAEQQATCALELCEEDTAVRVPAAQVRQVVLNLLRNAAESRPEGGVHIDVQTAAPVWQDGEQWVELVIRDDGPGLPAAVMARLFEPASSGKGEGHSGLGLSIVKQLMDDMEAIISCQSTHSGTRFRLLFPADKKNEDR